MSHPSLGLPPPDSKPVHPEPARKVRLNAERLAARALRVAMDGDATIEDRHDETGLRQLLLDATLLAERIALAVETDQPGLAREYAEWTASLYRRRRTPLDDLIRLCEGLRSAMPAVLAAAELPLVDPPIDAAIGAYRWHRRIAGDARRRNAFLQFLYKGA